MANAYEVTTKYNTTKTAKTALRNWKNGSPNWKFYFNVSDEILIELCGYYCEMPGLPNRNLLKGVTNKNSVRPKYRFKIISALAERVKQEKHNGN